MSLYKCDKEIAELVGVGRDKWLATVKVLEREGFPARDPRFCNRRYWPACKHWLDEDNGLRSTQPVEPGANGEQSRAQERFHE